MGQELLNGRSAWLAAALLLALTIAAYGRLSGVPFVYEDAQVDRVVQWDWHVPSRLLSAATLAATSRDPVAAHRVSLALHLATGALVGVLVGTTMSPLAGVAASTLLLLHPLASQAVIYAIGQEDVLMTLFIVAACALVVAPAWTWLAVPVLLLAAAMTKEIGVIGAGLVLWTALWQRRWPLVSVGLVAGVALLTWDGPRVAFLLTLPGDGGGTALPWTAYVVRQIGMSAALLVKVIVPTGFAIDHDAIALSAPALIAGVVAAAGLLVGVVATWRTRPAVAWALGWIALALAPRCLIGNHEFIAERHLYLPMVGVAGVFGALFTKGTDRWARIH